VSQTAFFTPTLTYDANDAFLTLTRNLTFFSSVALTSNQHGVGGALDAAGGGALVQAVAFAPSATMQQTLDRLSGEIHGSVQSVLVGDSLYMRQAMLGRLRQASYAGAPGAMAALGFAGPDAVSVAGEAPALAYAGVPYPVKAPPAAPSRGGSDVTYWMQGLGAWGRIDGDGNASAARSNLGGFLTGFDARFGDWGRAGIAGGFTHASVNVDAAASSAGIDTAHLGVYGGTSLGAFNLRSGAAYAWHTIDTTRTIAFPGFFDQATGRYNGGTGQVFGEVGYGLPFGRIAAEPFAGLAYVRVDTSGFNETGGAAALAGGNNADNVLYSSLGLRIATSYMLQNGMALVPRFSAAWQHAFGDVTPSAALAFQSTGTAFTISGVPLARDAALVEAGFNLRVNPQMKLGASYTGELAGHLQDHAVKGTFTWNF
jgi:outer membrane autotransporter protein